MMDIIEDCQTAHDNYMNTMHISLSDKLKTFIDEQVSQHGYDSCGDYVSDWRRPILKLVIILGLVHHVTTLN